MSAGRFNKNNQTYDNNENIIYSILILVFIIFIFCGNINSYVYTVSFMISFLISVFIQNKFKLSNHSLIRKLQLVLFMIISLVLIGYIYMYIG